jgi:hypothetical protein
MYPTMNTNIIRLSGKILYLPLVILFVLQWNPRHVLLTLLQHLIFEACIQIMKLGAL